MRFVGYAVRKYQTSTAVLMRVDAPRSSKTTGILRISSLHPNWSVSRLHRYSDIQPVVAENPLVGKKGGFWVAGKCDEKAALSFLA
jgi:hypothetical protein